MSSASDERQHGFSLLELLVAIAIMAISLGMIYRASGGNVRSVVAIEQYQNATLLGESLVSSLEAVPPSGLNQTGVSGQLGWTLKASRYVDDAAERPFLQRVDVNVSWTDQGRVRNLEWTTLRPERDVARLRPSP